MSTPTDMAITCAPFTASDGCGSAEWCFPSSATEGDCIEAGTTPVGDACTMNTDCVEGAICQTDPDDGSMACRALCDDPGTVGGDCSSTEVCRAFASGGTPLDFGTCEATCTPWTTSSECEADEWCVVDPEDDSLGSCIPAGTSPEGTSCTFSNECQAGTLCLTDECTAICDPDGDSSGVCETDEACGSLFSGAMLLPFGTCQPSCDYDAGTDCTDSSLTCVADELFGAGFDSCADIMELARGASCTDAGLTEYEPCGGLDICAGLAGSGIVCSEACRFSMNPASPSDPHPDCSDPDADCVVLMASLPFGVCR